MAATNDANTAIKNRLAAMAQFHPATVNLFDGWLLDPGDIVTVSSGENDYNVPIYSMDVTWKGSSRTEIQSTGSEKRPPLSALRRNSYATGRRQAQDEEDLEQVIYRTDFTKTDRGIGLLATAVGVKIDNQTGLPAIDPVTGDYEFDENGASLTGQINIAAGDLTAEVVQARGSSQTLRAAMDLKANSASLSAVMDNDGQVTAASVTAAINATDGTSLVAIDADHVYITGNTKLSGQVEVDNGSLRVKTALLISGTTNGDVVINNGTITAATHQVRSGGEIVFVGANAGEHYDLDATKLVDFIRKASLDTSTNTLTLWKFTDSDANPSITFSKATAPTIGGSWNGSGTYTITSSPSAAAGSKLTVTPTIRLNGSGGTSFSAEMLNDSSSPTVERSVTGYLHQSGNSVNVYKTYSGGTYSDIIASVSVSGSTPLNDDCRLTNFTWHSSGSVAGKTALTTLSSLINSHKNDRGYIFLEGYVVGGTGAYREYYITIGTV